tara:strand:+ start:2289 stop:2609 length:321 start_codon:yes stop_codon:yes gene_type:complete
MKNRIKIDGEWYIREDGSEPKIDPTFFVGASSGKFTFNVLLQEDSTEFWEGTQYVDIVGSDLIDSEVFLREFRDNTFDTMDMVEFTKEEQSELRQLLIMATDKGWL